MKNLILALCSVCRPHRLWRRHHHRLASDTGGGEQADTSGDASMAEDAGMAGDRQRLRDRACTSSRDCGAGFTCVDGCCREATVRVAAAGEPCGDVTFQGECWFHGRVV